MSPGIEGGRLGCVRGVVRGVAPGPTLIVVGGLHGNEPAGVEVGAPLLARLAAAPPAAGEVVVLAGNPEALAVGRRYLARDLNRQFTPERIAAARTAAAGGAADVEQRAALALADAIAAIVARARGPVFAVDLHTTSADGVPFSIVIGSPATQEFAARFPLPGLVGLEGSCGGTLGQHLGALGCVALAIEGGQHESAAARTNLEAVVTIALAASELAPHGDDTRAAEAQLTRAGAAHPRLIEVVLRHAVDEARTFRMEPGFANIQRTPQGTLLAREGDVEIRAPFDGLVLLPLYQPQGTDGFYYGRELTPRRA